MDFGINEYSAFKKAKNFYSNFIEDLVWSDSQKELVNKMFSVYREAGGDVFNSGFNLLNFIRSGVLSYEHVLEIRELLKKGTIIKCSYMDDPYPVPVGTLGVVEHVDDAGTVHTLWANGSSLGILPCEDGFDIIDDQFRDIGIKILYAFSDDYTFMGIQNDRLYLRNENDDGLVSFVSWKELCDEWRDSVVIDIDNELFYLNTEELDSIGVSKEAISIQSDALKYGKGRNLCDLADDETILGHPLNFGEFKYGIIKRSIGIGTLFELDKTPSVDDETIEN